MWTGKTENNSGPEWDFIFLTENGIIPEDLCNRPWTSLYMDRELFSIFFISETSRDIKKMF